MIGLARSTLRYQTTPKDDDELRLALIRLAKQYGCYGHRKIAQLLRMEGWTVNHKKVERLWREEGLQLPQRHKRRKRLYHKDGSVIRLRPKHPNHIWSVDFVHDKLSSGRRYKMLTVIDEYTRQALCVAVATKMGHAEVLDALYPLFLKHGKPEYLRSDNGPEFIAGDFQTWLKKAGIKPIQIYPGSPGRTVTTNASTERSGAKCSMPSGSQTSSRRRPSSTGGSNSTITSVRIRRLT
ncbi:MAG: DDE-type integrase/transposase/recombinase [Alphaproteobacteria bacterium]|nr:DDE-type integrase/transposase/recombinase [Alphaproteobacteria bacterium]